MSQIDGILCSLHKAIDENLVLVKVLCPVCGPDDGIMAIDLEIFSHHEINPSVEEIATEGGFGDLNRGIEPLAIDEIELG